MKRARKVSNVHGEVRFKQNQRRTIAFTRNTLLHRKQSDKGAEDFIVDKTACHQYATVLYFICYIYIYIKQRNQMVASYIVSPQTIISPWVVNPFWYLLLLLLLLLLIPLLLFLILSFTTIILNIIITIIIILLFLVSLTLLLLLLFFADLFGYQQD